MPSSTLWWRPSVIGSGNLETCDMPSWQFQGGWIPKTEKSEIRTRCVSGKMDQQYLTQISPIQNLTYPWTTCPGDNDEETSFFFWLSKVGRVSRVLALFLDQFSIDNTKSRQDLGVIVYIMNLGHSFGTKRTKFKISIVVDPSYDGTSKVNWMLRKVLPLHQ